METRFVKVTLALNPDCSQKNIEFKNITDFIMKAKNNFNESGESRILITKINSKSFEFILKIYDEDEADDISSYIDGFIAQIQRFVMEEWADDDVRFVKIKNYFEVQNSLCRKYVRNIEGKKSKLYSKEEVKEIFQDIIDEDSDAFEIENGLDTSSGALLSAPKKMEDNIGKSLKEVISELDDLIGIEETKKEVKETIKTIKNIKGRNKRFNIANSEIPFNIAIKGKQGTGKDTIAKLIYKALYHLKVVSDMNYVKIDEVNITGFRAIENAVRGMKSGVVYIDGVDCFFQNENDKKSRNNYLDNILKEIDIFRDRFKFIISGSPECIDKFLNYRRTSDIFKFQITINDYTTEELVSYGNYIANNNLYNINKKGKTALSSAIESLKKEDNFENFHTVKNLIDNAIIHHLKDLKRKSYSDQYTNTLTEEDFPTIVIEEKDNTLIKGDSIKEIDSLIGLDSIKKRIKEILDYSAVQKLRIESGLEMEPLCLHMCFTGSPGTGKTIVARLLGKALYQIGILSKDVFVEVSRQDLVAGYVGQSAIKTRDKINQALGGILFVDEAYSLNAGEIRDYGHEVVAELIKSMEDLRDKLVVIFAGYTNEMEKFINMNPGIRDRIQFKIDFPDYNPKELVEIFKKFCTENKYTIDDAALEKVYKLLMSIHNNKDANFSNGRLVRKCFERIKMFQARRILSEGIIDAEGLMAIKSEDVIKLYEDEDIRRVLENRIENKRQIGFIG